MRTDHTNYFYKQQVRVTIGLILGFKSWTFEIRGWGVNINIPDGRNYLLGQIISEIPEICFRLFTQNGANSSDLWICHIVKNKIKRGQFCTTKDEQNSVICLKRLKITQKWQLGMGSVAGERERERLDRWNWQPEICE